MSNVVQFRRPKPPVQDRDRDVVALADDLLNLLDEVQRLAARAASTGRPALETERTVQNLLDAVSALERAVDCIGEGNGEGNGEGIGGSGPATA